MSAGHYKHTSGKRCLKAIDPKETREWVLNDRIADKIQKKLSSYDCSVIRLDDTTGEKGISLQERSDKANKEKADLYLAIHHNAGINGGSGGGVVAYTYTKPTNEEKEWQKLFYNAIIEKTALKGNRANPLAKANLHECREPDMSAILLECGFMDSKTDVPIILTEDFAEKVATACVDVIVKKAGLKKKIAETPSGTFKVQVGSFSSRDKAETLLNDLKKKGFDGFIVSDRIEETKSETPKKTNKEIAKEVIQGKWGNGTERKLKLEKAGYVYKDIQSEVSKLLKG